MKLKDIIKYSAFAAAFAFVNTSCSHEEVELYSGPKAGVFIMQTGSTDMAGNPTSYVKSRSYSFADVDEAYTEGETWFYVQLVGDTVGYDRAYTLRVVPDSTTAVEGVDYSLKKNNFVIPAGKNRDVVWVTLYRTPKLLEETLRIYFELVPNENFDIPVSEFKNSSSWSVNGPIYQTNNFEIKFNEEYGQPSYWSFAVNYLGNWNVTRYKTFNKIMGWTNYDWKYAGGAGKVQYGRMEPSAYAVRDYLQKMADAGTPVLDEDGSYMQLPPNYAVDYSAYYK